MILFRSCLVAFAVASTSLFAASPTPTATLATPPGRIVSLAPVLTDTLFRTGHGDRVVGISSFCTLPASAAERVRVGGLFDASLERILLLRPDVVVATPAAALEPVLTQLRQHHVPVVVIRVEDLDDAKRMPTALLTALQLKGDAPLVAAMNESLKTALFAHPQHPKVVVVVGHAPWVVAGPSTYPAQVLGALGALLVPQEKTPNWPQWSGEALLRADVDIIIAAEGEASAQALAGLTRARVVHAGRPILMQPGPALVDDIAALRSALAQEAQ